MPVFRGIQESTHFLQVLVYTVQQQKPEAAEESASPKSTPAPGKKRTVAGGIGVEDLKIGHGPEAKPGKTVSIGLFYLFIYLFFWGGGGILGSVTRIILLNTVPWS